ncbi:tRNA (adenosine(37)-N6)-threonylcarbamoyltransferase complex dimerization subunit type 1 TsaB [Thioclava sp. FR2]|uniref:tRNA (adenosine(37)-N6)-threonylcarbamoyltransferase complex dimerization subunit type 1 TsaB n=1 Tax=Thioclava sp. FR2 TaxID=3445780 RepID=UPI003EBE3F16
MPPKTVLAFDTSAAHCAAALLLPDGKCLTRNEEMAKGQAERLMPLLQELLDEAGIKWADLDLIGVGTGPGNFTGVRISVAAARGLALGLSIPAIGVTTFQALAFGQARPTLIAQDARRGMAYVQAFTPDTAAELLQSGDLPTGFSAPEGTQVIGELAELYASQHGLTVAGPRHPLAEAIARVALTKADHPQERPAPFYMRGADAAPPSDPPPVILDA